MPAYLDLFYISLLVYFGTMLFYLDSFYITNLSYFGTILFYYMFVNVLYLSIKKEPKTKHKNAYTFTAHLVNLPLTNYLNRSSHFYNIRGLIAYLYNRLETITNPLKTKQYESDKTKQSNKRISIN